MAGRVPTARGRDILSGMIVHAASYRGDGSPDDRLLISHLVEQIAAAGIGR